MQQQLQRHGSMEPLNDQQQIQGAHLDQNLIKQKNVIEVIACICFLFCTIYLQAMCMIPGVQICSMNGIEAPVPFQQSIIAYYFFTLIFLYFIYYALENVKHSMVVWIKWPLLLYVLAALIMGIVAIVTSLGLTTSDVQEGWNKLTQWRKQSYYNSSSTNLLDENKKNLIFIAAYHIIYGGLLLILFGLLFNYQMIMPQNWRPPFSSRLIQRNSLIYKSDYIQENEKAKQDEEEGIEKQEQQQQPLNQFQPHQSQREEPQQSTVFTKKKTGKRFAAKQVQDSQLQQQSQVQQPPSQQQSQVPIAEQPQKEEEQEQRPF